MNHKSKVLCMAVIGSVASLCCPAILFAQQPAVAEPAGPAHVVPSNPLAFEYQKLEGRIHELTGDYHTIDISDRHREEIRAELVKLTERQFDLRMDARRQELDRLRRQMDAVTEKVKRREELKQQIIERRVADLTREDAELQWQPWNWPVPVRSPLFSPGPAQYPGTSASAPARICDSTSIRGAYASDPKARAIRSGCATSTEPSPNRRSPTAR